MPCFYRQVLKNTCPSCTSLPASESGLSHLQTTPLFPAFLGVESNPIYIYIYIFGQCNPISMPNSPETEAILTTKCESLRSHHANLCVCFLMCLLHGFCMFNNCSVACALDLSAQWCHKWPQKSHGGSIGKADRDRDPTGRMTPNLGYSCTD